MQVECSKYRDSALPSLKCNCQTIKKKAKEREKQSFADEIDLFRVVLIYSYAPKNVFLLEQK